VGSIEHGRLQRAPQISARLSEAMAHALESLGLGFVDSARPCGWWAWAALGERIAHFCRVCTVAWIACAKFSPSC